MVRLVQHEEVEGVGPCVEAARERRHARDLHGMVRFGRVRSYQTMRDALAIERRTNLLDDLDAMREYADALALRRSAADDARKHHGLAAACWEDHQRATRALAIGADHVVNEGGLIRSKDGGGSHIAAPAMTAAATMIAGSSAARNAPIRNTDGVRLALLGELCDA